MPSCPRKTDRDTGYLVWYDSIHNELSVVQRSVAAGWGTALLTDRDKSRPFMRRMYRSLARAIIFESERIDAGGWQEEEQIFFGALDECPRGVRQQITLLLFLLYLAPVFRYARTFTRLSVEKRRRFLEWVQDSPVKLLRLGFWGLRTYVFLGHYGRKEVAAQLGYRVNLRRGAPDHG